MDFIEALRVLRRMWLVVIIGILATAGAGAYVITQVPTEYQAGAQYVLVQPPGSPGTGKTNPYLIISGGQGFVANLIASDMRTKSQKRSMVEGGFKSDYSLEQTLNGGPILEVLVVGTDTADVIETRDELLRRFDERLSSLQQFSGIPTTQVFASFTNAVDPVAEVVPGAKKKALVLLAAVGGITTLLLAFLIDGWRRRARERKAG